MRRWDHSIEADDARLIWVGWLIVCCLLLLYTGPLFGVFTILAGMSAWLWLVLWIAEER